MVEYILTDEAWQNIAWVYREGLDRFGEDQADKYLEEFYHLFELLADNPHMGVDFEGQGRKFQRYAHKSHIIIFEPDENGVKILNVFYSSSDYLNEL